MNRENTKITTGTPRTLWETEIKDFFRLIENDLAEVIEGKKM